MTRFVWMAVRMAYGHEQILGRVEHISDLGYNRLNGRGSGKKWTEENFCFYFLTCYFTPTGTFLYSFYGIFCCCLNGSHLAAEDHWFFFRWKIWLLNSLRIACTGMFHKWLEYIRRDSPSKKATSVCRVFVEQIFFICR